MIGSSTPSSYCTSIFFFLSSGTHRALHSFPTRRSSDLPPAGSVVVRGRPATGFAGLPSCLAVGGESRSEEHTSELQSRGQLVCRLLLEKKKLCSGGSTYECLHLPIPWLYLFHPRSRR